MTQKELINILKDLHDCARLNGVHDKYREGINFAIGYIAYAMSRPKTEYEHIDFEKWEERTNKVLKKVRGDI